ncbi:MAG: S9 family peptidase [Acidobacteria bacterium]|nr:S9 family peptidase [Acidobacteriota bacterium]
MSAQLAIRWFFVFSVLNLTVCTGPPRQNVTPPPVVPLIQRGAIGDLEKSAGAISPDGRWLAYVAAQDGVPNIFLAPRATPDQAKPITNDRHRGIRTFLFACDNRHLLYTQDVDGDENDRVFAIDLESGQGRALTPKGARAEIDNISAQVPGSILVNLNDRDPGHFDPVRIDLSSGAMVRLFENTQFTGFVSDENFVLRVASQLTDAGGKRWFLRQGDTWQPWDEVSPEDVITTSLGGFAADNSTLYMVDSRGRNTAAVFAVNLNDNTRTLLDEDSRVDLELGLVDPVSGRLQAIAHHYLQSEWKVLDDSIAADFKTLGKLADQEMFSVDSRTLDGRTWVVRVKSAQASEKTYLYDRTNRRASLWFDGQPGLKSLPLQPLHTAEIVSRDRLTMPGYYILPPGTDADGNGIPVSPLPMVLWVHGGPWDREAYGFKAIHQVYANRGYAVLSVNYRGSTGFGKAFVNAGNLEWGGKMQTDLLDAKAWAVAKGIARADRVAIVGGSYGGYAVLAAMTMTPGEFACGISVAGPSSLLTLLETIPPYWGPTRTLYTTRVGNPETETGRHLLAQRSPLHHVQQIQGPLLIGQGANDPRVKQSEAEQIVRAMQERHIPVTYVLFPDEGHGFVRTENDTAFSAVTEAFLGYYLGGRVEPVGDDFTGSSITIPVGAERLPEIAQALKKAKRQPVTVAP